MNAADLAARLGLTKHPRSWRGRCPACEYAGETFSVRERRAGFASLYCANGCDRDALDDAAIRVMGGGWKPSERAEAPDEATTRAAKQARALALWNGSEPAAGTPADVYLTGRGLPGVAGSAALRYRADTSYGRTWVMAD